MVSTKIRRHASMVRRKHTCYCTTVVRRYVNNWKTCRKDTSYKDYTESFIIVNYNETLQSYNQFDDWNKTIKTKGKFKMNPALKMNHGDWVLIRINVSKMIKFKYTGNMLRTFELPTLEIKDDVTIRWCSKCNNVGP